MNTLIIDDHPLFAQGLQLILDELYQDSNVTTASNLQEAIEQLERQPIDLVLIDLYLNREPWNNNLTTLKKHAKSQYIAVISSENNPYIIQDILNSDIDGYICKSSSPQVLQAALLIIQSGNRYIPQEILQLQTCSTQANYTLKEQNIILSKKQINILVLAAQGLLNKQIASQLNLSEATIKSHLSSAYRTLRASNKTQAVQIAKHLGLI